MLKKFIITSQLKWIFLGTLLTSAVGIDSKTAFAGCNPFGCSQSSVAECNPFGCPNPPAGAKCTPFGCPASPQPPQQPSAQPPSYPPYPYSPYPYPQPYPFPPNSGGNPEAIRQCMNNLMYRTEVQKPFPGWICVANDVNCKTVRVRTGINEYAAAQACQNAR